MPETIIEALPPPRATAERPLLGQTVLVVEDSRFASEALRLMCQRSGARIRRADSLRAAARHLATYRPSVAIIDAGLPDGSGLTLIAELAMAQPRIAVILASSGDADIEQEALEAGADAFLPKPLTNVAAFQAAVLAHLPEEARPAGPRAADGSQVSPDGLAFHDDLARAAKVAGAEQNSHTLGYLAQFLGGLGRSAGDRALEEAAGELACALRQGRKPEPSLTHLTGLVNARLEERRAV